MYRILQIRDGLPTTLFHGVDGSRTLPFSTWMEAEVKEVHDGSGGTTYKSGFHVMDEERAAIEYLKRFKKERPLVVCEVFAKDLWEKSHADAEVKLARSMRIEPMHWLYSYNPLDNPMPIRQKHREAKREAVSRHLGSDLSKVKATPA